MKGLDSFWGINLSLLFVSEEFIQTNWHSHYEVPQALQIQQVQCQTHFCFTSLQSYSTVIYITCISGNVNTSHLVSHPGIW